MSDSKVFDFIPSKIGRLPSAGPIYINSVELKVGTNEMCKAFQDSYFDELIAKGAIVFHAVPEPVETPTVAESAKKPSTKDAAK